MSAPRKTYDLRITGRWVVGLLWASILLDVALLLVTVWLYSSLNGFENGRLDQSEAEAAFVAIGNIQKLAYLIAVAISVICIVVSCMWIYRATHNAGGIAPTEKRIKPGWAVGWFFIPVANLWKPYQSIRQTWNTTFDPTGDMNRPGPSVLAWWWGTWIVSNILSNVSIRQERLAETLVDFKILTFIDMAFFPITIISTLLFLRIVRAITSGQVAVLNTPTFGATAPLPTPSA